MKVVIDSSIIIDYLRGGTKWDDFIDSADRNIELFLPTIVIFELFSGTSTQDLGEAHDMIDFIKDFQRIDLTENIAKLAGELFRDTKLKISAADYLIAASALSLGASVLTLNQKHFQQIPGLDLYENI